MRKSNMTAEEFKKIRIDLGLSCTDMAAKLGMCSSSIWVYENNKRPIPEVVAEAAKRITNIDNK